MAQRRFPERKVLRRRGALRLGFGCVAGVKMGGSAGDCGGLKEADRRSRRGSKEGKAAGISARGSRRGCGGEDGADKRAPLVSGRGSGSRGERATRG